MTALASHPPDPADRGDLEQLAINVIRGLAMDAPRAADSGHPGTAMALAPLAHVLFTRIMRHDPAEPHWPDRDRFVLSNGHASILLYSMLYLTGYGMTLDDLRGFRSWGSRTPGHPELNHTPGVEVTTGPLGQGVANGVGMGIAERWLRTRFSPEVCDHHTFVIAGDGCFEEGISHEAASLAGHLQLGRLVYVYDNNHITIDGPTELSYSDNVGERFAAYGWSVDDIGEVANDVDALGAALLRAKAEEDRPSLIILRSHIGYPSPHLVDTAKAHGDPFSDEEIRLTKELLGLPPDESFWVPDDVLDLYRRCVPRGEAWRFEWTERFDAWAGDKERWEAAQSGRGLPGWEAHLPYFSPDDGPLATRQAVKSCIDATGPFIPGIMPGSADLTGNTGMAMADAEPQSIEHPGGDQIHFGIREHGMGGVMTGMAAHRGVLPIGGTFFVFSDYMRGAVRIAALSDDQGHLLDWTHDSVGLGQDGPTHQPVEQLAVPAGHAQPRRHPAGRRQRDGPGMAGRRRAATGPPPSSCPARSSPSWPTTAERARDRRGQGRLRAPEPRRAGAPRSSSSGPAARSTSAWPPPSSGLDRRRGPGGLVPVVGPVRRPGRRLPARGPPGRGSPVWRWRPPARSDGSGTRTPPVCIDHFGASAPGDAPRGVRVHARARRRRGTALITNVAGS
jgi:transketolase